VDVPVPLPANSLGVWSSGAAAAYLVGVLLVGVGFLLLFLDTARAIIGTTAAWDAR
jgi:cytochrome c oxidase subunit 1